MKLLSLLSLATSTLALPSSVQKQDTPAQYQTTGIFLEKNFHWADIDKDIRQALADGYNRIYMGFYMSKYGCVGACEAWSSLSASKKSQVKTDLAVANAQLYLGVGGPGEYIEGIIRAEGANAGITLGQQAASFAKANSFDGLNMAVALAGEGSLPSEFINNGSYVGFVKNLATQAQSNGFTRDNIAITSHAPYFSGPWCNGLDNSLASLALSSNSAQTWSASDILLDMFNEGNTAYLNYDDMFVISTSYTNSSVWEVSMQGVPESNVQVLKPTTNLETSVRNGFVAPGTLSSYGCQANQDFSWTGGFTGWTWNNYDDYNVYNFGSLLSGDIC